MQSKRIDLNITTPIFPVPHSDGAQDVVPRVSAITSTANTALTLQSAPPTLHRLSIKQHKAVSTVTVVLLSFFAPARPSSCTEGLVAGCFCCSGGHPILVPPLTIG